MYHRFNKLDLFVQVHDLRLRRELDSLCADGTTWVPGTTTHPTKLLNQKSIIFKNTNNIINISQNSLLFGLKQLL